MFGYIDNELTKVQWITALRRREDRVLPMGEGQRWLGDMLEYHTPHITDDALILDIPEFLRCIDNYADEFVAARPHDKYNRPYIHSEWLQGYPRESIGMAQDLAYTCARIGGPDLGVAVGAHVLGGWYQLSDRCDTLIQSVYEPLLPYIKENDASTVKLKFGRIVMQINLLMMGRTIVIIDDKRSSHDHNAVHLQLLGSSFAEGVKQLGLQLVEAPTLGAALGVLDTLIAHMSKVPRDPDVLKRMLSEGRLWAGGVFTHI